MALRSIVKINSVSNLSDARYCAGMGVDMLGYVLDTNRNGIIDPESYREINDWISGVHTVGEFEGAGMATIREQAKVYPFDMVETTSPELLPDLQKLNKPIILKIYIDDLEDADLSSTLQYASGMVDYFILGARGPMQAEQITGKLREHAGKFPMLLATGINPANVNVLIDSLRLTGLALSGSQEIRPGYKEYDALADILEVLDVDG